ncbi:MAG TPA: caspase family protein [Geobacteraceae bacterium]
MRNSVQLFCSFLAAVLFVALTGLSAHASQSSSHRKAKNAASDDRGVAVVEKNRDGRKRIALVIGNGSYQSSPLKNPVNDARVMAATLRRLGFEVNEQTNLGFVKMNKVVEDFGRALKKSGGVGLFYYAGHGMQVNGANYLIPVDADIDDENEIRYKAVDAGLVLAKMDQAKSDVNIVILDACRDNPFARSFRSSSRGLASMDAPSGTFIAYATAPGKTAADGTGRNGLYTAELVRVLETPGIPLEQVFKRTLKAVREKSGSRQTPWVASNLEGEFFFVPSAHTAEPEPSEVPQVQPVTRVAPREPELKQDAATILLDHFNGSTRGSILAYNHNGQPCGSELPAATPAFSFGPGLDGLSQALTLESPPGTPANSSTYLQYPGGQLLSQPNGTIEFFVYLTSWGVSLVDQGPYYGSCAGWTFGMSVSDTGRLEAGAWAAFTMNSGDVTVPLNTWTHVAATWGSAGAKLYINGELVGSDGNTGMPASGFGGNLMLRLGTHKEGGARIDELRVSSVQRTSFITPP